MYKNRKYSSLCLTHWGRVTHTCVSKLTIIGSDNGLSPDRRQAIICTNAGLLLIGPLGTNFSEILIEILTFSFKKMRLKVSSAKRRPFCLTLNLLKHCCLMTQYGIRDFSQYGLMLWQHQAIALASFHLSSVTFCGIHLRAILQESNLLSNLWYKWYLSKQ